MKKTTLWKLTALVLLVAVCLPLIPKAVPPTEAVAVTTVAPLPYAMEQYGQHHSGIYSANTAIIPDGIVDDAYVLMDSYDDEAGNFNGVFSSSNEDGSGVTEIATEYVPDLMEIYGAYDESNVYLLVKNLSRTSTMGYTLTANFGFNFGPTQLNAQESEKTFEFFIEGNESAIAETNHFVSTKTEQTPATDSTGTYNQNTTVFEFAVPWSEIAPDGKAPETDFDKLYLSLCFTYYEGSKNMYRIYGVPNNVALPSGVTVGTAFGSGAGTFTPNVIHLLGDKGSFTAAPTVGNVDRIDKNTTKDREFRATLSLTGVDKKDVKEAGLIFTADASTLATVTPVYVKDGENVFKTTESTGETVLNFKVTFSTKAADYEKYFSVRPYILYSDDSVVYGNAYTNTPSYFDAEDREYKKHINLLMIGNSACTYYLDEMVQIAKADDVFLYVARIYKSGASSYENWTFLVNDYKSVADGAMSIKYCSPNAPDPKNKAPYTSKEIMEFADWDYISVMCNYKGDEYSGVYREGYSAAHPHMEDTIAGASHLSKYLTWLEKYYPKAELYIQEIWARQVGLGYQNDSVIVDENGSVIGGKIKSGYEKRIQRLETVEDQTYQYEVVSTAAKTVSQITGVPMVPCGDAFQIARANPIIGDTLCNRSTGTDYAHDGDYGGGQYLNACVFYEVMTGNDVRGNTWRPTGYDLPEEKVLALQEAAHAAVLAIYGEDHYTK